ncbi:kinase-like domain-containing protein, partial [Baffinella frigidus]
MEDYEVVRRLGSGAQGTTYQVRRKIDGRSLVVKQLMCDGIGPANNALHEAKTLQVGLPPAQFPASARATFKPTLTHPLFGSQKLGAHRGVVKYEDVFLHEERVAGVPRLVVGIVMELCARGDLAGVIAERRKASNSPLGEATIARWLKEICAALGVCHAAKILHRDALNILLTEEGELKLADFGLARDLSGTVQSRVGTPAYLAPEVLQNEIYGAPADLWGVGCIGFEAMSRDFLWERKGLLSIQVLSVAVNPKTLPGGYTLELRSLVAALLDKDPARRPTAASAETHLATLERNAPRVAHRQLGE